MTFARSITRAALKASPLSRASRTFSSSSSAQSKVLMVLYEVRLTFTSHRHGGSMALLSIPFLAR